MGNVLEPCKPYQNYHHQWTVKRKGPGSDGKSLPAASNGITSYTLTFYTGVLYTVTTPVYTVNNHMHTIATM